MIIKGLFRRYKRWNPVHPTYGAFWGMGLGFGCGVGWGPGFGPEVVGYVGAGCGVGFGVGFTLLGCGVGLPANYVFHIPFHAVQAARHYALPFVQSDWSNSISVFQRETSTSLSNFHKKVFLDARVDLCDVQSKLRAHAHSFSTDLGTFCIHFFQRLKGSKN